MSHISTEVKSDQQQQVGALALITLQPEQYAKEVYQPFYDRRAKAIESLRAIDYDIQTTKGMEVAVKARRLVADIRIEAEKERKARKQPITQIGKLLESSYNDLEAQLLPLESLFDDDIKAEEKRKEEIKKEKERAEAARIQEISDRIAAISKLPMKTGRMSSAQIQDVIDELTGIQIDDSFAEFIPAATKAWVEARDALKASFDAAAEDEAEAYRKCIIAEEETRKQARERAELAAKQAELERIANEQAAERKRLADEQAAIETAAAEQRRKAEENLRAEAEAQAARLKAEAEAHAAEMKRLADELAAERAKFEAAQAAQKAKDDVELKAKEDAARLEADNAEAIEIDKAMGQVVSDFNAATMVSMPDLPVDDPNGEILDAADAIDAEPTDEEIVELYIQHFGGSPEQAIERLSRFAMTVAHG
ncbi:MAG: hypothetical protein JO253_03165 [Alphaproteobacteria bacterium]|nr:hypothetical protein [Alphaproteobacteria bacterium]